MSVKLLNRVSPRRRDRMYFQIQRLIRESDAVDRSVEAAVGETGFLIDETMESIVALLRREFRRVKKGRAAVVAA